MHRNINFLLWSKNNINIGYSGLHFLKYGNILAIKQCFLVVWIVTGWEGGDVKSW